MVDIFPRKQPEPTEYEKNVETDLENRLDSVDAQYAEEARSRVEQNIQMGMSIMQPSRLVGSKYHRLLMQDYKVSFLPRDDVYLCTLWESCLDDLAFMGLEDTVQALHANLLSFLAFNSSVDGKEREALISTIARIQKEIAPPKPRQTL